MKVKCVGQICVFAGMMIASSALAQQTWAPPAEIAPKVAPAAPAQTPVAQKPTVAAETPKSKSKDCRAQADAKGLHGKARKAFRAECEKG